MNGKKVDRLSQLGSLQIAALALAGSAIAAVAVLLALRRLGVVGSGMAPELPSVPPQPAVNTASPVRVPPHFSEDVVVPGKTFTGADIMAQDDREGRSPEGV